MTPDDTDSKATPCRRTTTSRIVWLAYIILMVVPAAVLCVPGLGSLLFVWQLSSQIDKTEKTLCNEAVAESATQLLSAILAYMNGDELPRELGEAWCSGVFGSAKPFYFTTQGENSVRVEFGGGFHHIGYTFGESSNPVNGTSPGYSLYFYSEDEGKVIAHLSKLPSRDEARQTLRDVIDKAYDNVKERHHAFEYQSVATAYRWIEEEDRAAKVDQDASLLLPEDQ